MSMNIRANTDYSVLFSSLSTKQNASASFLGSTGSMSDLTSTVLGGSSSSSGINLGDYAAIKNGSYRKLLNAYYSMKEEEELAAKEAEKSVDTTSSEISKTDKTENVFATTWDDIVAEAEAKTDAMYTELGLKTNTISAGSYLDTLI